MAIVARHWLLVKKDAPVNYNYWLNLIGIDQLKADYNKQYWTALYGTPPKDIKTNIYKLLPKTVKDNLNDELPF